MTTLLICKLVRIVSDDYDNSLCVKLMNRGDMTKG